MQKKDIENFRKILVDLKKQIENDLDGLSQITSDNGNNLSHYPDDPSYMSSDDFEKGKAANIMNVDYSILESIDLSLEKIENGTYGKCNECGKNIEEKRLKAKPFAIYCLSCREKLEKEGKVK